MPSRFGTLRSPPKASSDPRSVGESFRSIFGTETGFRKGQLLIQLDDQLQAAQIKQSEAELSIARANHKRNQNWWPRTSSASDRSMKARPTWKWPVLGWRCLRPQQRDARKSPLRRLTA